MPTNCVWIDGVVDTSEKLLCRQFGRHGHVQYAVIDRVKCRALIYYDSVEYAQYAVNEIRGRLMNGKRLQVGLGLLIGRWKYRRKF